jgi:hypothetical protein
MTRGGLRKRTPPRSSVPRSTTRDTSISFRALGVLLYVLDQPNGWVVRAAQLAGEGRRADGTNPAGKPHRREGRDAIRTVLMGELAPAGYYRLERRRLRDGTIAMGTAVSEEPLDSWAEQWRLFGGDAVPCIEQTDGTFMIRYPDGSLHPDDFPPPESAYEFLRVANTTDDDTESDNSAVDKSVA